MEQLLRVGGAGLLIREIPNSVQSDPCNTDTGLNTGLNIWYARFSVLTRVNGGNLHQTWNMEWKCPCTLHTFLALSGPLKAVPNIIPGQVVALIYLLLAHTLRSSVVVSQHFPGLYPHSPGVMSMFSFSNVQYFI